MPASAAITEDEFIRTYDTNADAIFRHCYFRLGDRELGRDYMQETFIRAWEYIASGKSVENLRAFLYRTANNLIVDELRRRGRRNISSVEDMQERGEDIESGKRDDDPERSFSETQIVETIQKIEEPYRTAVIMRYIDGLNPKEIAKATGKSVNVTSVRINRGMKKLRSLLHIDE